MRRLGPSWQRAALRLGASVWIGLLLALFTDLPALGAPMAGAANMWLATAGAVLVAILAAIAAQLTSIPGRSSRWAALPVPALLLWAGASAAGCLRAHGVAAAKAGPPMHPMVCFYFIVLAALRWRRC